MNKVTQAELDWFVEGELDRRERDELFARLDSDPDGWKRCALALLERDALATVLGSTLNPKESSEKSASSAIELGVESALGPSTAVAAVKAGSDRKPDDRRFALWHLATAAAMAALMVVAFQYWLSSDQQPVVRNGVPLEQADDLASAEQPVAFESEVDRNDLVKAVNVAINHAGVQDCNILAIVSITVKDEAYVLPLIESEMLSKQLVDLAPLVVPSELTRKLARIGFKAQPKRQFISLNHEDGTNEVVPMNMLDCNFVGRPVF